MKPILFNTEMVRAILEGRKTVTRRVVKPQPDTKHSHKLGYVVAGDKKEIGCFGFGTNECGGSIQYAKPPYQVNDILYVRETWHKYIKRVGKGETCHLQEFYGYRASIANFEDANEAWKPSIHMPKEAARIFLRVTAVRVERLQDITEEGMEKEGLTDFCKKCRALFSECDTCMNEGALKNDFIELWDSTISKTQHYTYSWRANPYVWVIEFERITQEQAEGKAAAVL